MGINIEIVYFVLGMYKAHALLLSWVVASFSTSYERTRSDMFFLTFVLSCHSYTYFCCSCCSQWWFLVVVVGCCSFAPKPQERIQHCQTSTRCCILVFVVIVLLFWSGLFCFWRLFFHIQIIVYHGFPCGIFSTSFIVLLFYFFAFPICKNSYTHVWLAWLVLPLWNGTHV